MYTFEFTDKFIFPQVCSFTKWVREIMVTGGF